MRLKREVRLYVRASETEPWLPLRAGLLRVGSREKREKRRFFPVGREAAPLEEMMESVKVITLLFHLREGDAAQELLLHSGGKPLLLRQEERAKNSEITGYSAVCAVESCEEIEGSADEPLSCRVSLCISQEMPYCVKL